MRVEEFAQQLNEVRMEGSGHPGDLEAEISSQEVDEWLELFGIDEGDEEG
jgi:hypothetical protein